MAIRERMVFETSDGTTFKDKESAEDHEFDVQHERAKNIRDELMRWKGAVPDYADDMNIFSERCESATISDVNQTDFLQVLGWIVSNRDRFRGVEGLVESISFMDHSD